MDVVHSALYARRYAQIAEEAGINFTTYYTDYPAMRPEDRSSTRMVGNGGLTYNYLSSHDWRHCSEDVGRTAAASAREQMLFFQLVLGVEAGCTEVSPLAAACEAELDRLCTVPPQSCAACVRANAQDLIAHGCPSVDEGGFDACVEYCEAEASEWVAVRR